jgi:hypothetical protein
VCGCKASEKGRSRHHLLGQVPEATSSMLGPFTTMAFAKACTSYKNRIITLTLSTERYRKGGGHDSSSPPGRLGRSLSPSLPPLDITLQTGTITRILSSERHHETRVFLTSRPLGSFPVPVPLPFLPFMPRTPAAASRSSIRLII